MRTLATKLPYAWLFRIDTPNSTQYQTSSTPKSPPTTWFFRTPEVLQGDGAFAIHIRCMSELTKDARHKIEQIHSSWIEFEVAGQHDSLMGLCSDDIELWPPDAQPVLGRAAVSTQMAHGTTRIHCIEIANRRIRGSIEIAYLTASYKITFSLAKDSTPRQVVGSHVWILRGRAGTWVVTLVSWSSWALI